MIVITDAAGFIGSNLVASLERRGNYQYFTEAKLDRLRQAGYTKPMTGLEDGVRRYVEEFLTRQDVYR
jgi:ADP-L-glycero-D-manno-heptose 6-epimerase